MWLALLLSSCTQPTENPVVDPTPDACASGEWPVDDDASARFVLSTGSDEGDGSGAAPFATIEAALVDAEEGTRILVGPGEWPELRLDAEHTGITLAGCGAAETAVAGLVVRAATGVTVIGLSSVGATPGVRVWDGAGLAAEDIHVVDASGAGVMAEGAGTSLVLTSVDIDTVAPSSINGGFGLAIHDADVVWTGGSITGASSVGVLVQGGFSIASLTSVTVADTAPAPDGQLGRGVQVQALAALALTDVDISNSTDAGVVSLGAINLTLDRVTVRGTTAGGGYGDGVVVADGPLSAEFAELYFTMSADTLIVDGADRAGLLVSGQGLRGRILAPQLVSTYDPGSGAPLAQDGTTFSNDSAAVYDLDAGGETLPYDETDVVFSVMP